MELCSLHPFDESKVREFVDTLVDPGIHAPNSNDWTANNAAAGREGLDQITRGDDRGTYALTLALARDLAFRQPIFAHPGISLSTWEARVDRGVGMLMRPPSRILIEAGLDPLMARRLPIRLEMSRGLMGGAYIPARLAGDFERLLHARIERTIGRLNEAEWDGVAVLGMMIRLAEYASSTGLAIYEALDLVTDDGYAPGIPGASHVIAVRRTIEKTLRTRLEQAAKPPKKPGFFARLAGRKADASSQMNEERS